MKKVIVKKNYVTEIDGLKDYLIEKFNLTPLVETLKTLLQMILSMAMTYPMLQFLSELLEKINSRLELFRKVGVF